MKLGGLFLCVDVEHLERKECSYFGQKRCTIIQLKSQFLRSLHAWEQAVRPATASFILDIIDSGCSYVYCPCT
jgi:hypothetical protein